ncbi:MAG: efflux RND transporter periplasmic adaptor subunit, partial [Mesorhizobium sp.]
QGDVVVAAGTQFMTENLKVKFSGDVAQQSASAEGDVATTSSLR